MRVPEPIVELIEQRKLSEAEKCLIKFIEENGEFFDGLNLLGFVQIQLGKNNRALSSLYQAIEISDPNQEHLHEIYSNLSVCYYIKKDYQYSINMANQALKIKPDFISGIVNLSQALLKLERFNDAWNALMKGYKQSQNNPKILFGMGVVMASKNKNRKSIQYYKESLKWDPKCIDAYANIAVAFTKLNDKERALKYTEKGLSIVSNHALSLLNKAYLLLCMQKEKEGLKICNRIIKEGSHNPELLCGVADSLTCMGFLPEAIYAYQKCHELHPNYWDVMWKWGMALLIQGDLKQGFEYYEHRLKCKVSKQKPIHTPSWRGENLDGKTLLVRAEQGFGDSIQFLRYIPLLKKAYRCKLIVELQPHLHCLFGHLGCHLVSRLGQTPKHDFHVTMLSLPIFFQTELTNIPPPVKIISTRNPIKNRIGIAWKGNPDHAKDFQRSMPLKLFEPLFKIPGVQYVSLQKDFTVKEGEFLDAHGVKRPQLNSFKDTVKELEKCEKVISVDTSLIHLSASMGMPTWVLISYVPDWRWLFHRSDSVWYPSVKLFRQTIVDSWKEPLEEVINALTAV